MIEQIFSRQSGFKRFGATVIYPIKKDWRGNEKLLSLEDVERLALSHARRRELSDNVEVIELSFSQELQVYIAVYGHVDRGLRQ